MNKIQKAKELLSNVKGLKKNYKNPIILHYFNDLIEILEDYCEIKEKMEDDRR